MGAPASSYRRAGIARGPAWSDGLARRHSTVLRIVSARCRMQRMGRIEDSRPRSLLEVWISGKKMLYRSLRAKITLAYLLVGGMFVGLAGIAYSELRAIEAVIATSKAVADFFDATREVRNQEKNLLIYRRAADSAEVGNRFDHALALIDLHRDRFVSLVSEVEIERLREGLDRYRKTLDRYWQRLRRTGIYPIELEEPLHLVRLLVQDESERLARTADAALGEAVARHRRNLVASIAGVTLLLVAAGQLLSRRVVKPLRKMEEEMDALGRGQIKALSLRSSDQEIASLTTAFNRVISELETRQVEAARVERLATLGTMLSGMAHEINNPLSNISTSTQILLEEFGHADPEFQRQMLTQIDAETDRAKAIVRSLLDFAHERAARRERVVLADVVDDTLRFYRGQIPDGIDLVVDVPGELALNADRQRLQQVLLNLIKNAVEASDSRGEVAIRARRYPPPPGRSARRFRGAEAVTEGVDIEVADRGVGIAPATLARIFDPFFTTKEVGEGTGLGLFVSHEIVTELGGAIEAESEPGEGSVFHLRLPSGDATVRKEE